MSDLKIQGEVQLSAEGAERALDRVADKAGQMARTMQAEGDKASKAVDGIGTGASKSADEFTRSEGRISDSIKRATRNLQELGKTASQKLEIRIAERGLDPAKFEPMLAKLRELEAAQARVATSSPRMGQGLQNTSYQLQDFIVQVNGGVDATRALAMQLPQMLVGFGAAGAAIGVVAALLPNLITAFGGAADEGKKFSDAMSDYDKAISDVGSTVKTFDMEKLYEQFNKSSAAVRAATIEQIKFQQEYIRTTQLVAEKKFGESLAGLGEYGTLDKMLGAWGNTGAQNLAKQLGVQLEVAQDLKRTFDGLRSGTEDVGLAFEKFGQKLLGGNAKSVELAVTMSTLAKTQKDAAAASAANNEALDRMGKAGATGAIAIDKATKSVKEYDAAWEMLKRSMKLAEDELKAIEEARRKETESMEKAYAAGEDRIRSIEQQTLKMEDLVRTYGMSEAAIQRTIIAEMEEARRIAALNGAREEHLSYLDREIAARKNLAAAADSKEALDANKRATEEMQRDWEKMHDQLSQSLTDALMNGGMDAGEALQRYFKTLVLRPIIQGVVNAGLSAVGFGGTAQAAVGGASGSFGLPSWSSTPFASAVGNFAYSPAGEFFGLSTPAWEGSSIMLQTPAGANLANAGSFMDSYGGYLGAGLKLLQGDVKGAAFSAAGAYIGSLIPGVGTVIGSIVGDIVGGLFGGESGEKYPSMVGSAKGSWAGVDNVWTQGGMGYTQPSKGEHGSGQFGDPMNTTLMNLGQQFSASVDALFGAFDIDEDILAEATTRLRRTSGRLITDFTATIGDAIIKLSEQRGGDAENIDQHIAEFVADVMSEGIAMAVADSDLAVNIKNIFAEGLDADQTQVAIKAFVGADQWVDNLDRMGAAFRRLSPWVTEILSAGDYADLQQNAAEFTAMQAATAAYTTTFHSAGERLLDGLSAMELLFEDIGYSMPETKDGFRDLVESLDLTTESGREAYASLMGLSPAFAEVVGALETLKGSITNTFDSSIRSIEMDVLDNAGKYAYLDKEADYLQSMLSSVTDPALIAEYAGKLNDSIMAAWGLLDADQKVAKSDEFIDLLSDARDLSLQQIEAGREIQRELNKEQADLIGAAVKDAVADAIRDMVPATTTNTNATNENTNALGLVANLFARGIPIVGDGQAEVGYIGG